MVGTSVVAPPGQRPNAQRSGAIVIFGAPCRSRTVSVDRAVFVSAASYGRQPVTIGSACAGAGWTTVQRTTWGDLGLTFAGPAADDLRLVGWNVVARPDAARRFRMADGPVLGDPLTTWGAAYGDALDVDRLAGDAGQSRVTLRLPEGDVRLVGYAEASGNSVVARGGTACP